VVYLTLLVAHQTLTNYMKARLRGRELNPELPKREALVDYQWTTIFEDNDTETVIMMMMMMIIIIISANRQNHPQQQTRHHNT
jgi:ascorbate-specific PTS system EIIC-type component UlaA